MTTPVLKPIGGRLIDGCTMDNGTPRKITQTGNVEVTFMVKTSLGNVIEFVKVFTSVQLGMTVGMTLAALKQAVFQRCQPIAQAVENAEQAKAAAAANPPPDLSSNGVWYDATNATPTPVAAGNIAPDTGNAPLDTGGN